MAAFRQHKNHQWKPRLLVMVERYPELEKQEAISEVSVDQLEGRKP
jgi:hypothetical protein